MQTTTLVGLFLAALITLLIVFYQYFYKSKRNRKLQIPLAVLRFIGVFGVFLLLLNPSFTKTSLLSEKQDLIILLDDSYSIKSGDAEDQMVSLRDQLTNNAELKERFDLFTYSFGIGLGNSDSLSFDEKATNISKALSSVNSAFKGNTASAVLLSDGNQTIGEAYEFMGKAVNFPVNTMVVGDTTTYTDLRINQVNANRYAFLENTFPLEFFVSYQGEAPIRSNITIQLDGKTVFREILDLSDEKNSKKIVTALQANSVGLKTVDIALDPIQGERNTYNNKRRLSIEVIDEKTRIGLVSEVMHPDLGALIKAIESNSQRSVGLVSPNISKEELSEYNMLILYQPTPSFSGILQYVQDAKINTFTITGPNTNWNFLNRAQKGIERTSFNQDEEILAVLNPSFSLFDLSNFSVDDFPPLEGSLGDILITKPYESILAQQIKGVVLQDPLLPVLSDETGRHAYLFGENIWKWRIQSFRNDQNFKNFDTFINKLILYLTTDQKRERLSVTNEFIYQGITEKKIKASFFDATYVFDPSAALKLSLKGLNNDFVDERILFLGDSEYEVDINDLPAGEYSFTVSVEGTDFTKNGRFSIEDFDLEQLFVSSDYRKLSQLAETSTGRLYFPDQIENLIEDLSSDTRYLPTQKSVENVVSLIDFRIILGIIILAFTAEWFIRKYNGLI
ncbi:VWA domain-containing protein [uncultured Muriicola sp.]|uniref:VWA domain-containing protein n=1 Tax=uncultured Muriicola sp. TaxID=1583102 RepID=UPI002634E7EF|nr:VWA domain-containing protein [uncultured Muriicola sp.]